jgi:hypothetical protein
MLSRSESLISLATIQAIEPHDAQENGTPVADIATNQPEPNTTLCARCQNFDIQSFARAASRRKGYLLEDVEAAAKQGCQFCGLLLDAVRDIERPHYFYAHVFKGKTTMYPDLYVHMTVCKNDRDESNATSTDGLGATRFLIELGDRFSGMRNPSDHEICIAADPGRYSLPKDSKSEMTPLIFLIARNSSGSERRRPWPLHRR